MNTLIVIWQLLKKAWENRFLVSVLLLSLVLVVFHYYRLNTIQHIDVLEQKNETLNRIIQQQQAQMERLRVDFETIIKSREEVVKQTEALRKSEEDLKKKLFRENRRKKSLEQLARKKTSLIEKKVNDATKTVLSCFEKISNGGEC